MIMIALNSMQISVNQLSKLLKGMSDAAKLVIYTTATYSALTDLTRSKLNFTLDFGTLMF